MEITSSRQPRVGVVGVGTMGSQVLHQLAARGIRATGFERFEIGHDRGAAGGETRIFRIAYKEGGMYVPLLRRARRAWQELGAQAGINLLEPVGALTVGDRDDPDVRTVTEVAEQWGLDLDQLDAQSAAHRFPQHRLLDGDVMLLDREGGLLHPARAICETVKLAQRAGAEVRTGSVVEELVENEYGVTIRYRRGGEVATATFDQVIVCTGPWITQNVPALRSEVEVRRVALCWFCPDKPRHWTPSRFPVGIRRSGGSNRFSFFPDVGGGVKINLHVDKTVVEDPDQLDGSVPEAYVDEVSTVVARCMNGLSPRPSALHTYMEGYTADNHGIIGRLPDTPSVLAMGGFSGHGFKLAPVFAGSAVDLLLTGATDLPIDHLSLSRFATADRPGV
ncbi:putative sarcosine oxidase [Rhodococcus wratislaviensis NBRC 100605]|uniref:Putative sarcosine oxidase n=2 Tax=Rhodococcus wratislaviensis TaxID=44752 RepID=X0Q5A3_RHOWR|nr:putative sarcosine oxidase [Rhodococcus wratislaviensis NBRC 100605]